MAIVTTYAPPFGKPMGSVFFPKPGVSDIDLLSSINVSYSPTLVQVALQENVRGDVIGNFVLNATGTDVVSGTITAANVYVDGILAWSISGLSMDVNNPALDFAFVATVLEGADVQYGSSGGDWMDGWGGDDILLGFGGDDVIFADQGNDIVFGGDGDDGLFEGLGPTGTDWFEGNAGNDIIASQSGNDILLGGAGNDMLDASMNPDAVIAIGGIGADEVHGGSGNDWVEGGFFDNENDTVYGGAGNDTVVGGGGFDTLYGEAGDDLLAQADGRGMLYGGEGNDWLYGAMGYDAGTGEGDTLEGGKGADNLVGFGGNDYFVFNKADLAAGVLDTIHGFGDFSGGAFGPDQDVIRFTGGIVLGDLSYVDAGTGVTINVDLGAGQHAEIFVWGMQQASIADDITFI